MISARVWLTGWLLHRILRCQRPAQRHLLCVDRQHLWSPRSALRQRLLPRPLRRRVRALAGNSDFPHRRGSARHQLRPDARRRDQRPPPAGGERQGPAGCRHRCVDRGRCCGRKHQHRPRRPVPPRTATGLLPCLDRRWHPWCIDEVFDNLPCPLGPAFLGLCDVTPGTPVIVRAGQPATSGIDFVLSVEYLFADRFESGDTSRWSLVLL